MTKNILEKWSEEWLEKFKSETEKIKSVLNNDIRDIQHIGSTSIPGMLGKPLIDIAVLVDSIEDVPSFVEKLKFLDYVYKPDMSSPERIFLRKGNPVEYHLSIACPRHTFWDRQILFRDYLIKHPEFVEKYNALKLRNIKITPSEDRGDLSRSKIYNQGKADFVAKVLKLAKE